LIPIEESLIRATTLLDDPTSTEQRAEIIAHLDTVIDYARDETEERLARSFKTMALNHLDCIGRDTSTIVEEAMELALIAMEKLTIAVVERNRREHDLRILMQEFAIGQYVQLKAGGPAMQVIAIKADKIICETLDEKRSRRTFAASDLVIARRSAIRGGSLRRS